MDLLADFGDPRGAALMGFLGGAVGAVEVGEHLPAAQRDPELVMRQLGWRCRPSPQPHRPTVIRSAGWRTPDPAHAPGRHRSHPYDGIAEPVTTADQVGGADPIPTLDIGPTSQRPTPTIDTAVAVTAIHAPFVDLTDHRRQRTLDPSSHLFQPFEQLGELPPVERFKSRIEARIEQLLDPRASSQSSESSDLNAS